MKIVLSIITFIIVIPLYIINLYDKKNGIVGQQRLRKKFLFFPKSIKNEVRFLKYVTILQEYYKTPCGEFKWINVEWKD